MNFGDYSPPRWPSLDQQRDALQKGIGRAPGWALAGCLDDAPLLQACLHDQRFDAQIDELRGGWLWNIVQAAGAADRFRAPILAAFSALADERSAGQLCELARGYAAAGDEAFRARLYEIVARTPFAESRWLGEAEIVALDGPRGFLFAVQMRGRQLAGRDWECDDGNLIDVATERLGAEQVGQVLDRARDESVIRFREAWRHVEQRSAEASPGQSRTVRMSALPLAEVIRAAEAERRCFWLRGWGRRASEADLQAVLEVLWAAVEPRVIANLLRVFSGRALPGFDGRLIDLCRHSEREVRRRAYQALAPNAHPLVREFALSHLEQTIRDGVVVALFVNNYRSGDEERILEALEFPDDVSEFHWLLMDVLEVLEQNPEADCSRLGLVTYASTPCEMCRYRTARLLIEQRVPPDWLLQECRHDSSEDCRQLFS